MNDRLPTVRLSREVKAALAEGAPVVALESTIISHGLPRPRNLEVAREVEEILATLRESQVAIEDLELGRTDLEEVFLSIMQGAQA